MQKTAYEMRISDLSADVCSSDLRTRSAAETLDATVLIAFTYWLRGFELSTPDFVATRFLRRPGTLSADGKWLHIRLAPLAFDMVLGRAGYLDPVLLPDWRSEEHTSELQPLMRISYAVFCLNNKQLYTSCTTLISTP